MRKTLIAALFAVMALPVLAQESGYNNFKVNMLSPFLKTGYFSYERKLNPTSSFQFSFAFTGYSPATVKISGLQFTPEYRFFLSQSQEALEGFYAAPYLRYQNFKITVEDQTGEGKLNFFGGGVIVGHQWIFRERISLDMFGGTGYMARKATYTGNVTKEDLPAGFGSFALRAGVSLGVVF